jgi:hypothetical protein
LSITRCDSGVSACFAGGGSVGGRNGADRVVVVDCVVVVLCGEESGAVAGVAEVAVSVGVASAPVVVVAIVVFVVWALVATVVVVVWAIVVGSVVVVWAVVVGSVVAPGIAAVVVAPEQTGSSP